MEDTKESKEEKRRRGRPKKIVKESSSVNRLDKYFDSGRPNSKAPFAKSDKVVYSPIKVGAENRGKEYDKDDSEDDERQVAPTDQAKEVSEEETTERRIISCVLESKEGGSDNQKLETEAKGSGGKKNGKSGGKDKESAERSSEEKVQGECVEKGERTTNGIENREEEKDEVSEGDQNRDSMLLVKRKETEKLWAKLENMKIEFDNVKSELDDVKKRYSKMEEERLGDARKYSRLIQENSVMKQRVNEMELKLQGMEIERQDRKKWETDQENKIKEREEEDSALKEKIRELAEIMNRRQWEEEETRRNMEEARRVIEQGNQERFSESGESEAEMTDGVEERHEGNGDNESSIETEDVNNNNQVKDINRGYLNKFPESMQKMEMEWEMAERRSRKKIIFIRGTRTVGTGIDREMKAILQENLNMTVHIKKVRAIGGGIVAELESLGNKIDLMKRKGMLKGTDIWIEDDYTVREKEIQEWLESIAEEETKNGLETQVGYQKIKVQGLWYNWVEERGRLEQQDERNFY